MQCSCQWHMVCHRIDLYLPQTSPQTQCCTVGIKLFWVVLRRVISIVLQQHPLHEPVISLKAHCDCVKDGPAMQHSICFATDLLTAFMADCMGYCVVVQEAQAGAYASRQSCLRECAYAWLCQLCMLRPTLTFWCILALCPTGSRSQPGTHTQAQI